MEGLLGWSLLEVLAEESVWVSPPASAETTSLWTVFLGSHMNFPVSSLSSHAMCFLSMPRSKCPCPCKDANHRVWGHPQ